MGRWWIWAGLAACSGDKAPTDDDRPPSEGDADTDTDSDTDTDPGADGIVAAASCTVQPTNSLRFDCAVTTTTPAPVRVRLLEGDVELAVFPSDAEATDHRVTLWGMTPESAYRFEAATVGAPDTVVGGDLVTGPLPAEVDVILEVQAPGTFGTEHVLFQWGCGPAGSAEGLILARADGAVVWYQLPDGLGDDVDNFEAYAMTAEGTVLASLERNRVAEWDLAGNVLLDLTLADGELSAFVHHDIGRRDGLTYVLNAGGVDYAGQVYAMDGFDVIDGANGVVASWSAADWFDPTLAEPNASQFWDLFIGEDSDWAHGNALGLGDDGDVYVSLRWLNAIVKVAGDPADPEFGTVRWVLVGDAVSAAYPSDFTVISSTGVEPVDFSDQHHVSVDAAGDLLIWDNRASGAANSRALRMTIDEDAGTADIVEAWDAGQWCPGRGSAFVLPSGNVLGDCAPADLVVEIEDQTDAVVWSLHPTCRNGIVPRNQLYRAVPVEVYP